MKRMVGLFSFYWWSESQRTILIPRGKLPHERTTWTYAYIFWKSSHKHAKQTPVEKNEELAEKDEMLGFLLSIFVIILSLLPFFLSPSFPGSQHLQSGQGNEEIEEENQPLSQPSSQGAKGIVEIAEEDVPGIYDTSYFTARPFFWSRLLPPSSSHPLAWSVWTFNETTDWNDGGGKRNEYEVMGEKSELTPPSRDRLDQTGNMLDWDASVESLQYAQVFVLFCFF